MSVERAPSGVESGLMDRPLPSLGRVSVVVGAHIGEHIRDEIQGGRRPRMDVLELESALGATVYDFGRLSARRDPRAMRADTIRRLTKQHSLALAYDTMARVADDDVVYATGEDIGYPLAALMRAYGVRRPRLVVRLHSWDKGRTRARRATYDAYRDYALPRIDTVSCSTTAQLQHAHSDGGVPISKLVFVPHMTDATFFSPEKAGANAGAGDDAPDGLAKFLHQPYIFSAGLELRDYHTLVEAVRGLPVNLVISAYSPYSHFAYEGSGGAPLPPNVRVATFSPTRLRDAFADARFVVVPLKPTLNACGISVLTEGWAMRKAAVATRITGLLDYVVDGENGLFVEPYDVDALRGKILYLLDHDDEAARLGQTGRRMVERDFNLDDYATRLGRIMAAAMTAAGYANR